MATTLLEVKGLETRFYTQDGVVKAVNGISYTLDEGETLAIVGESGCGKSVSVLSLMRLIPEPPGKITGGEAFFMGRDLLKMSKDEIRQVRGNEIAMIFQDPMTSLNPVLTIGRQITEALELHLGMDKKQAQNRAIELLEMVGIPEAADRMDDYPHQFSGGMRQRVMIAMALSCKPQLLIADEPTTALDVTIQAQIVDLVKRAARRTGDGDHLDHPRPGRGGRAGRAGGGDVRGVHRGRGGGERPVWRRRAIPTPWACWARCRGWTMLRDERLTSIEGMPPDLIALPAGCPFAARCSFVIDRCLTENPPLMSVVAGAQVGLLD